jgi:predicted Zn-dependent protease
LKVLRIGLLAVAASLSACTINPVTGDRELALVSAADELAIGTSQYAPSKQMQGGEYAIDPALSAYVAQVGERLAAVSDRNLPYEFSVLNSSVPNAWALPGGKIAVNRGLLLELQSEAELAAVLGHEIVHAAARHGALAMQRGLLLQGAILATAIASDRSNYSNLAIGAASVGAQLINQRNSRGAELESDEYGMLYMSRSGYDPAAAVALQETFVRLSQSRSDTGWLAGLFASHPPSNERVERNRATAATLPQGGEIGRDRYAAATANLRASADAYKSFDNGREALADGRNSDARAAATRAIEAFPREANFHALLGDVEYAEHKYEAAADRYRAAISRNDGYFYFPLRLGLTLQQLGDPSGAERQLEASVALLPTADAEYGLGRISEQRGDIAAALEHYRLASSASSASGAAAQDAVVRLDLPANPANYLRIATGLDAQGGLIVEVANPTRLPVADIGLLIRYIDAQGQATTTRRAITETLPPNNARRFATGLGPFSSSNAYEVALERARVVSD